MSPQIPIRRIIDILLHVFGVPESRLQDLFSSGSQELFDVKWDLLKKELKKQYIEKIQDLHPDRHPERAEEAKALNNAWSAITNAEIKRHVRAPQRPLRAVRVVVRPMHANSFWGGSGTTSTTSSTWNYSYTGYVKI